MTKRMIDADALLKALKPYIQSVEICDKYAGTEIVEWEDLQIEINKLATPAPKPQESIFDADGWCWDINLAPDNENVIFYIINPDLKTKRATTGMRVGEEFYFARVSERDRSNAWKPLTLPKDKS